MTTDRLLTAALALVAGAIILLYAWGAWVTPDALWIP